MAERMICIRADAELFKELKMRVAKNGETLQHYMIRLIESDMANETPENFQTFTIRKELDSIHDQLVNVHNMILKAAHSAPHE